MTTFTSTRTKPTDVAIRLHEVEAVLEGVLNKLATPSTPDDPDLTEVIAALDRIYNITFYGSGSGGYGWKGNPQYPTVFDNDDKQRSLFTAIFGVDGYGLSWAQYLTVDSTASIVRLTYGTDTNIAQSLDENGLSLATATVGSPEMLTAIGNRGFNGESVAEATFGTAAFLTSLGTKSLAGAIFGSTLPITSTTLLSRIETLESQMTSVLSRLTAVENRLSAGHL